MIRWISPLLGTAAARDIENVAGIVVVDVRDLVDKSGNRSDAIREKIRQGVDAVAQGQRTVVCCDYGMSRSNAVAAGIVVSAENITFDAALRRVQEATGETQIKLEPLNAVREALGLRLERKTSAPLRTVFVTGGGGFVGRALCAVIGGEFRVVAPGREALDVGLGASQLDLIAREQDVDCVVHLANPRVYTSNAAIGATLTMLKNVIDVCISRGILLVYPSGWEIYSGYAGTLRADESTPFLPRGPYGETKFLAEALIEHNRRIAGLRCAVLRSSPVYGPGSDKPRFIYNFIEKARRDQRIVTHRYIGGDAALDLLYIDDFVSALLATLRSGFEGTLNVGTGELTTTRQIAHMIRDHLGSGSSIEQSHIESEVACIAMNWRRAHEAIQWQPMVPLSQGLERLLSKLESEGA